MIHADSSEGPQRYIVVAAERRRSGSIQPTTRDRHSASGTAIVAQQANRAPSVERQLARTEVHVARYVQPSSTFEAGRGEVEVEVGAGARDRRARADRGLGADVHVYRPEIEAGSRGDAGDGVAAINLEVHPRAGGTDQRQGI